ncbi:MAG: hypothetical protein AVDCRST_MAG03-2981, partial [uncultured Rubrobacteraceae bacterium]
AGDLLDRGARRRRGGLHRSVPARARTIPPITGGRARDRGRRRHRAVWLRARRSGSAARGPGPARAGVPALSGRARDRPGPAAGRSSGGGGARVRGLARGSIRHRARVERRRRRAGAAARGDHPLRHGARDHRPGAGRRPADGHPSGPARHRRRLDSGLRGDPAALAAVLTGGDRRRREAAPGRRLRPARDRRGRRARGGWTIGQVPVGPLAAPGLQLPDTGARRLSPARRLRRAGAASGAGGDPGHLRRRCRTQAAGPGQDDDAPTVPGEAGGRGLWRLRPGLLCHQRDGARPARPLRGGRCGRAGPRAPAGAAPLPGPAGHTLPAAPRGSRRRGGGAPAGDLPPVYRRRDRDRGRDRRARPRDRRRPGSSGPLIGGALPPAGPNPPADRGASRQRTM